MKAEVIKLLRAAKTLISDPAAWIKGSMAITLEAKTGRALPVGADDPAATCWCMYGALAASGVGKQLIVEAANCLKDVVGDASLIHWNDSPFRTHAEVMAAFSEAITIAEETQ